MWKIRIEVRREDRNRAISDVVARCEALQAGMNDSIHGLDWNAELLRERQGRPERIMHATTKEKDLAIEWVVEFTSFHKFLVPICKDSFEVSFIDHVCLMCTISFLTLVYANVLTSFLDAPVIALTVKEMV